MSVKWLETSTLLLARASSHTMFMVRMYLYSAVCDSVLRTYVRIRMMHVAGITTTLYVIVKMVMSTYIYGYCVCMYVRYVFGDLASFST